MAKFCQFLIVGSGIAGFSCAISLSRACPTQSIIIVSLSDVFSDLSRTKLSRRLEEVSVHEHNIDGVLADYPNIAFYKSCVNHVDLHNHVAFCENTNTISFSKICLATGASPKLFANHPLVIGVRDRKSVKILTDRVRNSRQVAIIGNGGIALELVSILSFVEVFWVVRDHFIGDTFFDSTASEFLLPGLDSARHAVPCHCNAVAKGMSQDASHNSSRSIGPSVGPGWIQDIQKDIHTIHRQASSDLHIIYGNEVLHVFDDSIQLTNGTMIHCDAVISATGVVPNMVELDGLMQEIWLNDDDGGLVVNEHQQPIKRDLSAIHPDLFAIGDLVHLPSSSPLWFQMRLWSQAQMMGHVAAQVMSSHQPDSFDIFSHVTEFCGFKVYLLGKFNGQGLINDKYCQLLTSRATNDENVVITLQKDKANKIINLSVDNRDVENKEGRAENLEIAIRLTPALEYVKLIGMTVGHRQIVVGAMIISRIDSDNDDAMAFVATIENVMLSQIDVSCLGGICQLLSQDVDIDDFFD